MLDADAIVVGGGHSGLTAAATLAKAGQRVVLVERRDVLGGRAAPIELGDGFRVPGLLHDTQYLCPQAAGELELAGAGLQRDATPPAWLNPQATGAGLLVAHDPDAAHAEIAAHDARDADRYADFRAYLDGLRPAVEPLVRRIPPDPSGGLAGLVAAGWKNRGLLLRRDLLELARALPMCVADWLSEWFTHPLLRAGLALPAVAGEFTGPWSPGTNALLLLQQCTLGGAVRGGPAGLIEALRGVCAKRGVTIRTGSEVAEILVEDGAATGVRLVDGSKLRAARVVAAASPKLVLTGLLPAGTLSAEAVRRARQIRTRGTTAVMLLGVRGALAFGERDGSVARVRVAPSLNDVERAFDPIKYGQFADRPALDVWIPSVETPGLAPEGDSVVSVHMHYVSDQPDGGWSEARRATLGNVVRDTLGRYVPGIGDRIVAERLLTPTDLADDYALPGGHLGHGEHGLDQLLVRPTLDCARYATPVRGLFLASSGCFPGGGLTCVPGRLGAKAACG